MNNKQVFTSLFIMALSLASAGYAQVDAIPAEIKSVNEGHTRILIQSDRMQTIKTGDILNVGEDCTLEVTQKKASQAVLSAELCNNKQLLKKGTSILLTSANDKEYKPTTRSISVASKGFRFEFLKSFLDGKLKANDGSSVSGKVEHDFGLGFGYANIGVNKPGFITRLIFTQYNNAANSIRIDGSGTYGVSENFYFLGGLNLHKFTKGADKLDIGFGFQFGAGLQINENFGLGLTYVTLNNSGNVNGVNIDYEAKGLEVNLHGTF